MSKIVLVGFDFLACSPILAIEVCIYLSVRHAVCPDTWQRMANQGLIVLTLLFLLLNVYLSIESD